MHGFSRFIRHLSRRLRGHIRFLVARNVQNERCIGEVRLTNEHLEDSNTILQEEVREKQVHINFLEERHIHYFEDQPDEDQDRNLRNEKFIGRLLGTVARLESANKIMQQEVCDMQDYIHLLEARETDHVL